MCGLGRWRVAGKRARGRPCSAVRSVSDGEHEEVSSVIRLNNVQSFMASSRRLVSEHVFSYCETLRVKTVEVSRTRGRLLSFGGSGCVAAALARLVGTVAQTKSKSTSDLRHRTSRVPHGSEEKPWEPLTARAPARQPGVAQLRPLTHYVACSCGPDLSRPRFSPLRKEEGASPHFTE